MIPLIAAGVVALFIILVVLRSFHSIGATEIGLVNKKFSHRKLDNNNPIAFRGEAGYQAELLMPGLRFKFWPLFSVTKSPWAQVPAGEIGVVIAQVGSELPIGAKSGIYKPEFGNFTDLEVFIGQGGQKGVQRPVLPPGTLMPIHPIAFLVLTASGIYGQPVSPDLQQFAERGQLSAQSFGLSPDQLRVVKIAPQGDQDYVGIVTTLEGDPLPSGDIASRLGGFNDITALEAGAVTAEAGVAAEGESHLVTDAEIIEVLLGSKNNLHNNYQDFQLFLSAGGKIGLQHDPILYGAYLLNPFLVQVEMVPMLVVNQGEVAVIKGFVGLPTLDTSGVEFKFGSIVRPGHRGIWQEPLRTGKYPINPRVYAAEIVPTSILTLNWADATSQAHNLDSQLSSIIGKSREGFVFQIDLQVQIHVPDTKAPKVISMVGTMMNLVNEVLQSAVGNHFRNTLQALEAVVFIETRQEVQEEAMTAISHYLAMYEVETKGVYIQDVVFPPELVDVLTKREIANQEKATFEEQQKAQTVRVQLEAARGTADMQAALAKSAVSVDINKNQADAKKAEADGTAAYTEMTGRAEAARNEALYRADAVRAEVVGIAEGKAIEAKGLAQATATEAIGVAAAKGYENQARALGQGATALVAIAQAVADGRIKVVPDVLTIGQGGSLDSLAATLTGYLATIGGGDEQSQIPEGDRDTAPGEGSARSAEQTAKATTSDDSLIHIFDVDGEPKS